MRLEKMVVSDEFRRLKGVHYMDHAAGTLYSEQQMRDVMEDLCSSVYGNPHSLSIVSKQTDNVVDQIRYRVLQHFNTNADEYDIIFTSGATAALKLVAESFNFGCDQKGAFVYKQENHTSILGMREVVAERCSSIKSLSLKVLTNLFSPHTKRAAVETKCNSGVGNSLFAVSAQCNFSGAKMPLEWVEMVQDGILENATDMKTKWFCLLDATSLISTSPLDLSLVKPDFVTLSFYKIFGYPSGLGALLVKNSSSHLLSERKYFGGGTVLMAMSGQRVHKLRPVLHERFEDGTLPYLSIISIRHGFNTIARLAGSMDQIRQHTFSLARRAHHALKSLCHYNNNPVAILYCDNDFEDPETQGPIVNFNLLKSDGSHVGYHKVLVMANSHNIQLRTGCFCNPGACQRHLGHTDKDLQVHFQAGHICGDQLDLINGLPTGSARISFGYMSTEEDVNAFLNMIYQCFVDHGSLKISSEDCQEEWHDAVDDVRSIPTEGYLEAKTSQVKLSQVVLYPIKSCGGFKPNGSWAIGPRGLIYDRTWMIVSAAGTALTQSLEPRLALVHPHIDMNRRLLHIRFSGYADSVSVPLDETDNCENVNGSLCQSKVCGDRIKGVDCGDAVASWLSSHLGRIGIRLVRQLQEDKRQGNEVKKALALSNKAQFLMVSAESVSWLAEQIQDDLCIREGLVDRFRANLIIEGPIPPFSEKKWSKIKIGTQHFSVDGPCTRCGVVCVDQATGERTNEPLRTLSKISQRNIHFGMYLSHQPDGDDDGIGLISCGNLVSIIEAKSQDQD